MRREKRPYRDDAARDAFTLVEMLIVIAVVGILLALSLPSASRMWEERNRATAENTIRGVLMVARSNALKATDGQTGMFFFVRDGTQQIAAISQAALPLGTSPNDRLANADAFTIQDGDLWSMPGELRVVPRYVVDEDKSGADDANTFSKEELARNDVFIRPEPPHNEKQRHRNFFTIVFSTRGELIVDRTVIIQDRDDDQDQRGDFTGMPIGFDHDAGTNGAPTVDRYYNHRLPAGEEQKPLPPEGTTSTIPPTTDSKSEYFPLVDRDDPDTALDFPSVDGLLVYDDSLFMETDDADKRDMLLRTGRPLYINRLNGSIIRGPLGEAEPES